MYNKVVYIISAPLSIQDYERYGAETLIQNGFDVCFFNVTPFIYPELYKKAVLKNPFLGDKQLILPAFSAFKEAISNLNTKSFIISLIHYNPETFRIYWEISKSKISYAVAALNCVATFSPETKSQTFFKRLKRISLSRLPQILKNNFLTPKLAKKFGLCAPKVFLAGAEISLNHHLFKLTDKNTQILWMHTFEYDQFLKLSSEPLINEKDKIVFIDAPTPRFKFDSYIPGISSPLTEEKYYPSLCQFFRKLEKTYHAEAVIAGHPKSNHEERPSYFEERKVLNQKTAELIRASKLVINRNSTAINYVVLYKKPVIFHTSDEAETCPVMSNQIRSMAKWLGKTPVNIDHLDSIDLNNRLEIDEALYERYKSNFIKKTDSLEIPMWQIFCNWLKEQQS